MSIDPSRSTRNRYNFFNGMVTLIRGLNPRSRQTRKPTLSHKTLIFQQQDNSIKIYSIKDCLAYILRVDKFKVLLEDHVGDKCGIVCLDVISEEGVEIVSFDKEVSNLDLILKKIKSKVWKLEILSDSSIQIEFHKIGQEYKLLYKDSSIDSLDNVFNPRSREFHIDPLIANSMLIPILLSLGTILSQK